MKGVYLTIVGLLFSIAGISQAKKVIGVDALGTWPSIDVDQYDISNDGLWCYYAIQKENRPEELIVVSGSGARVGDYQVLPKGVQFTQDSKKIVFINAHDSLAILTLSGGSVRYVPEVGSFKLSAGLGKERLVYLTTGKKLVCGDVSGSESNSIDSVRKFTFGKDGSLAAIAAGDGIESVFILSENGNRPMRIWQGKQVGNFAFDNSGSQLAFAAESPDALTYTIFYYKAGMAAAASWLDENTPGLEPGYSISNSPMIFSTSGKKLLFELERRKKDTGKKIQGFPDVDIWNYKDKYLQSEQIEGDGYADLREPNHVYAVAFPGEGKLLRISNADEWVNASEDHFDEGILIIPQMNYGMPLDVSEAGARKRIYIVSATTGKRTRISATAKFEFPQTSPDGRFVVWFDLDSMVYRSYDIATGVSGNLSAMVPACLFDSSAFKQERRRGSFGIAGWMPAEHAVLLYDQYDIWKVDLDGAHPSVNVTAGYGHDHQIVYSTIVVGAHWNVAYSHPPILSGQDMILSGYSRVTKKNGFWKANLNRPSVLRVCVMDDACFYISRVGRIGTYEWPRTDPPRRAKLANRYLLIRMSAGEFPNLYTTSDFKEFKIVSDLHPEKQYNWFRTELISWKMNGGRVSQGILYKPENFDSTTKYPLIITYYGARSDELHEYLPPELCRARIDIPYFVSNGYLIFVPDIHYTSGKNGESVLNSVVSAVRHLSACSWIDPGKIGIQGHSFGGWETNYLVTHTHLFAAACEAAGVADQVSGYNYLDGWGGSRQLFYEEGAQGSAYGDGVTPWNHTGLYIANSPIFFVGNVTTPLLMMQGDADRAVPFGQSIELFLALRRAGKQVWFLQYEKAGHVLWDDTDAKDFTIRMKQFFDHYLKDAPAPKWMTEGIPAKMKGIDLGYETSKNTN